MVRILDFANGERWIARLRMPPIDDEANILLQREVDCMMLVRERSSVPVPEIYSHQATADLLGAPFMLLECLQGNAAIDLTIDLNDRSIPSEHKASFYTTLAKYHAEISSITFPKIGSIVRLPDGTYDVGPLPTLGGPFETATEYLQAWAKHAEFYGGTECLIDYCGGYHEEILRDVLAFPQQVSKLAGGKLLHNRGPFPLIHVDFLHSNIVVDDEWNIIGVIDWESAQTAPWQTVEFPQTFSLCPRLMDAPWNYDDDGIATDEETRTQIKDREEYLDLVRRYERRVVKQPLLPGVLGSQATQDLATAMRFYTSVGKAGWYSKIFDAHKEHWGFGSVDE